MAMFMTGFVFGAKYSSEVSKSKTYNLDCVKQFNYSCGFCPESGGEYFSCENGLMVKSDGPNQEYLIIALCLILLNPGALFAVFLMFWLFIYAIRKIFFTEGSAVLQNPQTISTESKSVLTV